MVRKYDQSAVPTVYNISEIPEYDRGNGLIGSYFRGMDVMVGFPTISPDRELSTHSHPWEQTTFVLSGACEFTVDEKTISLTEGDIVNIPPNTEHGSVAINEPVKLISIWPVREDYLEETSYQKEFESL